MKKVKLWFRPRNNDRKAHWMIWDKYVSEEAAEQATATLLTDQRTCAYEFSLNPQTEVEKVVMPSPLLKYFDSNHLPVRLQKFSFPLAAMAHQMDRDLPDGPEKEAGLRKLLEAKDCFVRAALDNKH